MLDNHTSRLSKALHALPSRIRVGDVVERQLLALELLRTDQGAQLRIHVFVKGRLLVRVLAVTHFLHFGELCIELPRKCFSLEGFIKR